MPEPISSRVDDRYSSCEPESDDALVCKDGSKTPISSQSDGASTRGEYSVTARPSDGIRGFHAGVAVDGNSVEADAYALKGRDAHGIEVEVYSASARVGNGDGAVQAGMARIGVSSDDLHFVARGEAFTAQARASRENADGSDGYGVSAGATLLGFEGTLTSEPVSVTAGLSFGTTYGVSAGVRDADHDGKAEYCARFEFGVGVAGGCVERFW